MRRAPILVAVLASGCAAILGVDKDYEDVGAADASTSEVGDGTTPENDAAGDSATGDGGGDGGLDAAFDGTPYVPLATGDVRVYYAKNNGDVGFRTWSIASKTWSTPTVLAQYTQATVPWVRPTLHRGAEALALLDVPPNDGGATVSLMGTEPGWNVGFTVPNAIPSARAAHRGFDVAFTAQAGDTIAAYADGTASPKFRRRTAGGAWSAEAPALTNVPGIAAVDWVEPVAHPTTNEVTLLYTDTTRRLYGAVWNGTAWGASATILDASGLNPSEHQSFTASYESVSGDLLVVWARTSTCNGPVNPVYYATKASGSTTFVPSTAPQNLGAFGPIASASEPGTNRIVFIAIEQAECCNSFPGCNDLGVGQWDGTQWTSIVDHDPTTAYLYNERPGSRPAAAGWLGTKGVGVGVYTKPPSGNVNWEKWTAEPDAGWGTAVQPVATLAPATTKQTNLQMVRIPSVTGEPTGNLVLLIQDENGSLWAKLYDGAAFVDMNNGAPIVSDVRTTVGRSLGMVTR